MKICQFNQASESEQQEMVLEWFFEPVGSQIFFGLGLLLCMHNWSEEGFKVISSRKNPFTAAKLIVLKMFSFTYTWFFLSSEVNSLWVLFGTSFFICEINFFVWKIHEQHEDKFLIWPPNPHTPPQTPSSWRAQFLLSFHIRCQSFKLTARSTFPYNSLVVP